jgi:hypothetical protein
MADKNGTLTKIYLAGVAVALSTNTSLDVSMATRETTNKDSGGWKGTKEGLRSWSGSGDFIIDYAATKNASDIFALMTGRTRVEIKHMDNTVGQKFKKGYGYITAFSENAPVEETMTGSFSFEGDGALEELTLS